MTYPAAPACTQPRWPTAPQISTMPPQGATSAGRMPADQRRSWRSTNPPHAIASAPCSRWNPPRWRPSTAATRTAWSLSPEAKGPGRPTLSASSSPPTCTTKWTSYHGSSARATGAATTRLDLPITDRNVQRTLRMRTTTNSLRRPESSELMLWTY